MAAMESSCVAPAAANGGQQPPQPVKIAFVLCPGFTALDIIGPFEVLAFVPGIAAGLHPADRLLGQATPGPAPTLRPRPGRSKTARPGSSRQTRRSMPAKTSA